MLTAKFSVIVSSNKVFILLLPNTEREALKTLRENPDVYLKKADKGTQTVVLYTEDKIREGQIQLDNLEHYKPLERPMDMETSLRVQQLVKELHQHNYIYDMTNKWFCQTPVTRLAHSVLHANENSQTNPGWKTNNFWM